MSTFIITIIAAAILIALSILGIGIGYLITGKSQFTYRKCGSYKEKKKGKGGCSICGKKDP